MRFHIATIADGYRQRRARELFVELAAEDVIGRHVLEDDPSEAEAIVFVDPHLQSSDPLLGLRIHPLYTRYEDKAFVYDECDSPVYSLPGIYVGATPRWSSRLPVLGGPYPRSVTTVALACDEPDLLFSFRGARSHPVRDVLCAIRDDRAIVEASDVSPWGKQSPGNNLTFAQVRHIRLIHRSKFVLCPRGSGAASHRLYETLAAGRVPVVISDDWLPPPNVAWSDCTVRIAEADAGATASILAEFESEWHELSQHVLVAREKFARTHLWDYLAQSIALISEQRRPTRAPWWVQTQRLRIRLGRARASLRART